jgi:hypothetical protein
MSKEFFDGQITWKKTRKSVTLTRLTREQMEQVLALIKASGVGFHWKLIAHHHTPPLADRLSHLWQRAMVWMVK